MHVTNMSAFDIHMYVIYARKMYMYIDTDNIYVQEVMQVAWHAMKPEVCYQIYSTWYYIEQFVQVRNWKLKNIRS